MISDHIHRRHFGINVPVSQTESCIRGKKKKKRKKKNHWDRNIMSRYLCKELPLHWNIWGIWCNQSTECREQLLQKVLINFYLHFGPWVSELPSSPSPTFLFWKTLKIQKSCNDDTMISCIPFLVTNIYHFLTFAFYHSCLHNSYTSLYNIHINIYNSFLYMYVISLIHI